MIAFTGLSCVVLKKASYLLDSSHYGKSQGYIFSQTIIWTIIKKFYVIVLSQEIWIGMLSNTLEPPCGFELEKKVTNDVPWRIFILVHQYGDPNSSIQKRKYFFLYASISHHRLCFFLLKLSIKVPFQVTKHTLSL